MVDKKYVVTVTTKAGEVSIGTDDVKGVLSQLGHTSSSTVASDGWDDAEAISNHMKIVEERVARLQSRMIEVEKKMNEIVEVLNETPAPVQQPVIPQRSQPQQSNTAFLDVTPDRMTQEVWAKLTQDQKEQYAQKYMQKK